MSTGWGHHQEMYFNENPSKAPKTGFIAASNIYSVGGHKAPNEGKADRLNASDFGASADHFSGFDKSNSDGDILHVHGYNVNAEDSRGEQAEAFKRLYWSGSRARFWGISWYGYDSQTIDLSLFCLGQRSPDYHVNVRHAFNAGRLLENFVRTKGPGNATLIAHSLGNMVASSAVQNGMPYARYLMANPAVAEESYAGKEVYDDASWNSSTRGLMYHPDWRYPAGAAVGYAPFLWSSEWYKLFSDERSKLTWRDLFSKVRNDGKVYAFFAPTDEAFRPFTYDPTAPNAPQEVKDYPDNKDNSPGFEDVLSNWSCSDREKIGTYSWAFQELLKGRIWSLIQADSSTGGWGFNYNAADNYVDYNCVGTDDTKICTFIKPHQANLLDSSVLMTKPLFKKNSDNAQLYTEQPVDGSTLTTAMKERILADEVPAVTFAAGHRGVSAFAKNIDIRAKYLTDNPNTPWPRGTVKYEWRHSDLYNVAYPYVYLLYDDWITLIKGGNI